MGDQGCDISRRLALAMLFAGIPFSSPSAAEPVPDYVGLSQKAERLAVAVSSVKTCVHFGYADRQQDLVLHTQQLIDEAELAGIAGSAANLIVVGSLEAENQRQQARTDQLKLRPSDKAATEQFLDYWEQRCDGLAADPVYGRFFRP
jgi:hypothetical protein